MSQPLFTSEAFTAPGSFTSAIEGPACDVEGNLYAVNYDRPHTVGRVTPEGETSVFLEFTDGSSALGIRFDSKGYMLIADKGRHNILRVNMQTRDVAVLAHEPRMHQPNDIAITSDDIVFASDPDWTTETGQLWRIEPNGRVTLLEDGMGTTNGIEVSTDEHTLYVNESRQRRVLAYDLASNGEISNKRLFFEFPDFGLDGMRCDVDGVLYVTRFEKGTVVRLSPDGEMLSEIPLLGKKCTNIAFGGSDGCTCYVTVADNGNVERFRADRPGRSWMLYQRRRRG
jgi:sugar lactone lactonase YvrE